MSFVVCLRIAILLSALCALTGIVSAADDLAKNFASPPASARPWVYWFCINGNISKTGITADLEAMKRFGIGGVLWMEVRGMAWAPDGPVVPAPPLKRVIDLTGKETWDAPPGKWLARLGVTLDT